MKKIITLALALTLALSLAACGGTSNSGNDGNSTTTPPANNSGTAKTQKADGAQMEDVARINSKAESDSFLREVLSLSGLEGLGCPVGTMALVNGGDGSSYVTLSFLTLDNVSVKVEDAESYAKAVWNLCIDAADDRNLYGYISSSDLSDKDNELKSAFDEAVLDTDGSDEYLAAYRWQYVTDGNHWSIQISAETERIRLKLFKLN